MEERMAGAGERRTGGAGGARGRSAIAASILGVLLLGGYFAASRGELGAPSGAYWINAVVLAIAFWFPARRIGSPRELLGQWKSLLPWLLAWTLVWDLATSGILGTRGFLAEWWIVYPAGVLVLLALLLLHAFVVRRVDARSADDRSSSDDRSPHGG